MNGVLEGAGSFAQEWVVIKEQAWPLLRLLLPLLPSAHAHTML